MERKSLLKNPLLRKKLRKEKMVQQEIVLMEKFNLKLKKKLL